MAAIGRIRTKHVSQHSYIEKMAFLPDLSDLGAAHSVNRARHLMFGVGQSVKAPDGSASRILIRDT